MRAVTQKRYNHRAKTVVEYTTVRLTLTCHYINKRSSETLLSSLRDNGSTANVKVNLLELAPFYWRRDTPAFIMLVSFHMSEQVFRIFVQPVKRK